MRYRRPEPRDAPPRPHAAATAAPPSLPSVRPSPPPHPSPHSVSPVVPTASCREMASSGASPRRRAAAGPSVRGEPPPSAEPAARRRKGGGGGVRPASRPARLRRSPSPFLFPAEEKLVHCGSTKSHGPAPAGPACADKRLRGRGAGGAAPRRKDTGGTGSSPPVNKEGLLWTRVPSGIAARGRTSLRQCWGSRYAGGGRLLFPGSRGRQFGPGGAAAGSFAAVFGRVENGPGGAGAERSPAAGLGACGLGRAPRRAAILGEEPNCSPCSCSWNGRLERAASSPCSADWGARAALVEAFGQPRVCRCEPALVLCTPSGPRVSWIQVSVSSTPLAPKSELHEAEGPFVQAAVGHHWCQRRRSVENEWHSM